MYPRILLDWGFVWPITPGRVYATVMQISGGELKLIEYTYLSFENRLLLGYAKQNTDVSLST